ncbi:homocysteine S-methyltransferase family protein [Marinomonas transparens]|uniref:Homocysteine S-methyltransferase family protein n=1 Tax=Marinomonas transparens TaxID=2795388 RepID=A0A934N218_9GAMM|nr:homocysteine S-methyltransferase family protein [Marinomonas transparens]MBJ7537323.1 homocysteine S-methyltransferase family protein [Marinomonas transparens]
MTSITILDGGLSRELERLGAPFRQPEWSALALMETPNIVKLAHQSYIDSGARVITTNSYAVVPFHIGETAFKEQGHELAALSGKMARNAVEESNTDTQVAGCLPPLFGSYRADLFLPERVNEIAIPLIESLNPYVDIWLSETQSLIEEVTRVKALVDKIDTDKKPFWASFTLEDAEPTAEPVLRSGETVVDAVKAMHALGVNAILFNCSQPEIIGEAIQLTKSTLKSLNSADIQIGAYANAFPPQPKSAAANEDLDEIRKDLTPPAYLTWVKQWNKDGATLIGGCCGIGPEHIKAISQYQNTLK